MHDPGHLLANVILMGDGWSATSNTIKASGFDDRSGAGRVHGWSPQSMGLFYPPFGWSCHTRTFTSQSQQEFFYVLGTAPLIAEITLWKGVMVAEETDRNNAAHFSMVVANECPQPPGPPVVIASDSSYGTRKRLRLTGPGQIAGKCLRVTITALHLPTGQTRKVHACDYFHGGTSTWH